MVSRALNVGLSIIATEHFFTFTLSSLPTTKQFFKTEEQKHDVRRAYFIAGALSLGTSALLSYLLKDPSGFIVTCVLVVFFIWLYERALGGQI